MSRRSITQIVRQASSPSTLVESTRTEIAPNEPPQAFQHLREQKRDLVAFLGVKESDRRICRSHQERILAPWGFEAAGKRRRSKPCGAGESNQVA